MSIAVVGKAAHKLAREQGFRGQFYLPHIRYWRTNLSSEKFYYGSADSDYRVHPDDQAAFIAKNTPAPVAKHKIKSVTVWQGVLLMPDKEGVELTFDGGLNAPLIGSKALVESKLSVVAKKYPSCKYQIQKLRITAKGARVVERVDIN